MRERIKYKVISAAALFAVSFAALFTAACVGYTEEETVIGADRTEIFADGSDAVVFSVDFAGENVTAHSVITRQDTGEVVEGGVFTTETPGTYQFVATYSESEALPITITAREAALQLSTDYYADGETSHFTFKALFGTRDLSTDNDFSVINDKTGEALERDADGYYRVTTRGDEKKIFYGRWREYTSSTVTTGPVKFYKRVGILEFTGTWCQWCPQMARYIKGVDMDYPDRYVLVAVHGGGDSLEIPYAKTLEDLFKVGPYPVAILDFGAPITNVNNSAKIMEGRIRDMVNANPAECGIAISSEVEGTAAKVNVKLLSGAAMEYGIAVALTENGITGPAYLQKMPEDGEFREYVHDDTLREVYQNNITGVEVGEVAAGVQAEREFTFDLKDYNAENCNIVVFATSLRDGKPALLNAAECKLGESVDFQYESIE